MSQYIKNELKGFENNFLIIGPIENEEIQLTVQGQTITSNFGTIQSAQYNLEQLISSGVHNSLSDKDLTMTTRGVVLGKAMA